MLFVVWGNWKVTSDHGGSLDSWAGGVLAPHQPASCVPSVALGQRRGWAQCSQPCQQQLPQLIINLNWGGGRAMQRLKTLPQKTKPFTQSVTWSYWPWVTQPVTLTGANIGAGKPFKTRPANHGNSLALAVLGPYVHTCVCAVSGTCTFT